VKQPPKPRRDEVYLGSSGTKIKGSGYLGGVRYEFNLTNVRKDLVVYGSEGKERVAGLDTLRAAYKQQKCRVELDLAFTKDWRLTQWMAQDVYVRFKMDVIHLLDGKRSEITDWKTGRFKPEEEFDDQLNGYAVAALTAGFGEETTAQLCFTDQGQTVRSEAGTLKRSDLGKAQKALDARAKRMFVDKVFPPRAGNSCRWCPFSSNKGGPCEY